MWKVPQSISFIRKLNPNIFLTQTVNRGLNRLLFGSSVIPDHVWAEDETGETRQQRRTIAASVCFRRADKNRPGGTMGIWTKTSLPRRTSEPRRGPSCWGFWRSIVPLCYLRRCASASPLPRPPDPYRLRRTLLPFSARPQRRARHCLKCCKWDTEPYNPNKRGWKRKTQKNNGPDA